LPRVKKKVSESAPKAPPAATPQARENQMIALAVDLAEKQLRSGEASTQVIVHYLKLATERERLENEKKKSENELLKAKTESLQSAKEAEELYSKAIEAMRRYSGVRTEEDFYEE
jgi:hypothetical protein